MITINKQEQSEDPAPAGPLALHIRRLRQWYGEKGISQIQLAALAGLTRETVHGYENRRSLPTSIKVLLQLALALNRSMEELLDPRYVGEIRRQIEQRRCILENDPNGLPSSSRCRHAYAE